MRCDRCGKEITGDFFEFEGDLWEEFGQSDLEMILCDMCYTAMIIIERNTKSYFRSEKSIP